MRPRDRVLTALRRQVPDRVPVFMRMTPPVLAALKARTGFDSPEEYFAFEIREVAFPPTRRPNDYRRDFADVAGADGLEISEWGVGRLPGSLYHFRKITSPMAFWGTVGTQTTFPFGRPADIRAVVKERMDTVGKGGGFLIAPTHRIMPEVPWENIESFVTAARELGVYR